MPRVEWAILSKSSQQDEAGLNNILGILDEWLAPSTAQPPYYINCALTFCVRGSVGESVRVGIDWLDPNGGLIRRFENDIVLRVRGGAIYGHIMEDVGFPSFGEFAFLIRLNGEEAQRIPLYVLPLPPMTSVTH